MEITYLGGNGLKIDVKKDTFFIDAYLEPLGLKPVKIDGAVFLATQDDFIPDDAENAMVISTPGEYEVRGASVKGIAAQRMVDVDGVKNATIYRLKVSGITLVALGHIHMTLDEQALEEIGIVDILAVPVGGNGYTLDAHQAASLIAQLEPKVIIPTHYDDAAIQYPVPQNSISEFIKEIGGEHQTTTVYKVKAENLPQTMSVVEITRS